MNWQWANASHGVVVRTNANGSMESHSILAPAIAAWLAAGGVPDPEPGPPPLARLNSAIAAGCAVVSAGTAALSGTWGITSQDEINLTGLQTSILAGAPWLGYYRDIRGVPHTMTAPQFTELATTIFGYLTALAAAYAVAEGGASWVAPASPVEIA